MIKFLFGALIAMLVTTSSAYAKEKQAIFGGGCFWCLDAEFGEIDGIKSVMSGFSGGDVVNPTYEQVVSGKTGHVESVLITYDPNQVTYQQLLDIYWNNIDPTDPDGQFADRGPHYRTKIFYQTEGEKSLAEASKKKIEEKLAPQPVYTTIEPAGEFYPAAEYHQDYYKKNPIRYNAYKYGSGRVKRLNELWDKDE